MTKNVVHPADKKLITAFFVAALGSVAAGGLMGLIISAIKAPAIPLSGVALYYQTLTAHAIFMFVYWLTFMQAALIVGAVTY